MVILFYYGYVHFLDSLEVVGEFSPLLLLDNVRAHVLDLSNDVGIVSVL